MAVAARVAPRQEPPRHAQRADHVRLVHRAPVLVARVLDAFATYGTARGVDQNTALGHSCAEPLYGRRVRDIEADGARTELLGESMQAIFSARTHHDVEALGG